MIDPTEQPFQYFQVLDDSSKSLSGYIEAQSESQGILLYEGDSVVISNTDMTSSMLEDGFWGSVVNSLGDSLANEAVVTFTYKKNRDTLEIRFTDSEGNLIYEMYKKEE